MVIHVWLHMPSTLSVGSGCYNNNTAPRSAILSLMHELFLSWNYEEDISDVAGVLDMVSKFETF